ncbi:MAG: lytic murein transglycosylase [Burkholderiaceae bacterium]
MPWLLMAQHPEAAAADEPTAEAMAACLRAMAPQAESAGLSRANFLRLIEGLEPDPEVLRKLDYQPEFVTPVWEYLELLVNDKRIANGQAMLAKYRDLLASLEATYGVAPEQIIAIWGVESSYGERAGQNSLMTALGSLSCFGRRQSFFRRELMATLQIVDAGHIAPGRLVGSWAGAFGHTQFMPSTFLRLAVDQDGDGRRDLIGSVPDALGSTANYLQQSGWQRGQPWGFEIRLPDGVVADSDTRRVRKPLSQWLALGVQALGSSDQRRLMAMDDTTPAALIRPADTGGPAFIVFANYDAVFAYNPSVKYALAINHLADRIAGGGPFVTPWPTEFKGLTRTEREAVQQLLLARGHDIGAVDGILGSRSREAIKLEQQRLGQPVNGRADKPFLEALRAGPR